MEFTDKQRKFCDEYLVDLNAKQAAIRAGYSPKTAKEQASRLLTNVNVQQYLSERQQKISDKLELDTEWVLKRLKSISDRCMQAEPVLEKVDGEWIESGEFKFDSNGANRSTELIGKHLGMFSDKVDVTSGGEKINLGGLSIEEKQALYQLLLKANGS